MDWSGPWVSWNSSAPAFSIVSARPAASCPSSKCVLTFESLTRSNSNLAVFFFLLVFSSFSICLLLENLQRNNQRVDHLSKRKSNAVSLEKWKQDNGLHMAMLFEEMSFKRDISFCPGRFWSFVNVGEAGDLKNLFGIPVNCLQPIGAKRNNRTQLYSKSEQMAVVEIISTSVYYITR